MSDFDPMDFQPNSVGVLVVRVIRLQDIVKALRCTEDFAREVVREIRGKTSADGKVAFVLPSQLAAWAYKEAGKPVAPFPFKTVAVNNATDNADALRRAATKAEQQEPPPAPRAPKSGRKKLILSKREAAKLLGVGRNKTLHELIARGLLKTVVVNGHVKVPRADVARIAREGFDLDAPEKSARRQPAPFGSKWKPGSPPSATAISRWPRSRRSPDSPATRTRSPPSSRTSERFSFVAFAP